MEWRVRLLVAVAAIWASRGTSSAAVWKDGCPAFFPPENAPSYTADVRTHSGSAAFGTFPEIDSMLGPTRVGLETWVSRVRPVTAAALVDESMDSAAANPRRYEFGSRLHLQANFTSGPMMGVTYSGYLAPSGEEVHYHLGNMTTFLGYRHTGYLLGPMFRTGLAVRVARGGAQTARTSERLSSERQIIAINSPFRASSFGTDSPFIGSFEYRLEAIGCRNPFLDFRVDVSRWRSDLSTPAVYDVPIELAFGAYPWSSLALYAAIGEELRSRALGYRQITRITLGLQFQPGNKRFRIGLRASGITGTRLGGGELGVTIDLLPQIWKGTLE